MKEVWKDIKGFEGLYRISNFGRLSSHKQGFWNIMSNINQKGWYLTVNLIKDKKSYTRRLHRLVYESFIGEIPKGFHIHHKDGNKQNNHVNNLLAVTASEHTLIHRTANHNIIEGLRKYNKFVRPNTIQQLSLHGELIAEYPNAKEAYRKTGVCSRDILMVANRTEWKPGKIRKQAGGYIWKIKA